MEKSKEYLITYRELDCDNSIQTFKGVISSTYRHRNINEPYSHFIGTLKYFKTSNKDNSPEFWEIVVWLSPIKFDDSMIVVKSPLFVSLEEKKALTTVAMFSNPKNKFGECFTISSDSSSWKYIKLPEIVVTIDDNPNEDYPNDLKQSIALNCGEYSDHHVEINPVFKKSSVSLQLMHSLDELDSFLNDDSMKLLQGIYLTFFNSLARGKGSKYITEKMQQLHPSLSIEDLDDELYKFRAKCFMPSFGHLCYTTSALGLVGTILFTLEWPFIIKYNKRVSPESFVINNDGIECIYDPEVPSIHSPEWKEFKASLPGYMLKHYLKYFEFSS